MIWTKLAYTGFVVCFVFFGIIRFIEDGMVNERVESALTVLFILSCFVTINFILISIWQ